MNEQIAIDIFINSTKSAKSVGDVKKAFDDLQKSTVSANSAIDQTANSSMSLKAQLKAMTLELQGLEPGSARFNELSRSAGALRDQIADTNAVINATAGSAGENLGKGLGTATKIGISGFQGMQSAAALFGGESEDLQRTLVQLQAVAGLSGAIESLGGMGDQITNLKSSFGAFFTSAKAGLTGIRGAVIATGIGALVVAVGLLVAYWDDIKAAATGVTAEMEKENELAKKNTAAQEKKLDSINLQENAMRLAGKSEKEILQMKVKQTGQVIKAIEYEMERNRITTKAQVDSAKRNKEILKGILIFLQAPLLGLLKAIDEIANLIPGVESDLAGSLLDFEAKLIFDPDELQKKGDEEYNALKDKLEKMQSAQKGFEVEIKKIEEEAENERRRIRAENGKKQKETNEEIAKNNEDLRKKTEDAQIAAMDDAEQRDLKKLETDLLRQKEEIDATKASLSEKNALKAALDIKYEKEKGEIELKYKTDREAKQKELDDKAAAEAKQRRQDEINAMAEGQDKEIAQLQFTLDEKLKLYQNDADMRTKLTDAFENAKALIEDKYREEKKKKDEQAKQEELDRTKELVDQVAGVTTDAINTLGAIQEASMAHKLKGVQKGSKEEEAIQKKGFEQNKKIQIALAVVNGLQSVIAAYLNGVKNPIPMLGPVTGTLYAGIAAAASAANIAKMAATTFQSSSISSSGGGGGGTPGVGGGGGTEAAGSFQPGQFFSLGQGAVGDTGMNGVKSQVYVGDINRVQNKVEVIENRATLGQ